MALHFYIGEIMPRKPKVIKLEIETKQYEVTSPLKGWLNNQKLDYRVGDILNLNKSEALIFSRFIKEI